MIKILFPLVVLLMAETAFAETVDSKVDYAFDTSGKTALHVTADDYVGTLGVGAAYTRFTTSIGTYNSAGLQLLVDYKISNYSINGRIGVADYNVTPYFLGNISLADKLTKHITISTGITGDIVDSVKSLKTGTSVSGYNINAEINYGPFDTLITGKQSFYSNGNIQSGVIARTYVKLIDGFNLYTSQRYIVNSLPSNGYFFSPPDYSRFKFGAEFKKSWKGYTVSGSYDRGVATSYGRSVDVSAWKAGIEKKIKPDLSIAVNAGFDLSDTNYVYHFVNIGFNKSF
jgi:hypothetical protein